MALKPYRATSHWKKLRLQVLNRDAWTCAYCGGQANEVDHVYPKSRGGEDSLDNCVAACKDCNIRKRDSVFLGDGSTPPLLLANKISPIRIGANQSKTDMPKTITVRISTDSPFSLPDQSGG